MIYLGECPKETQPVRMTVATGNPITAPFTCPLCGGIHQFTKLTNTIPVIPVTPCGPACQMSFRIACDCTCAGANHAAIWAPAGTAGAFSEEETMEAKLAYLNALRDRVVAKQATEAAAYEEWAENNELLVMALLAEDCEPNLPKGDARLYGLQQAVKSDKTLTGDQLAWVRATIQERQHARENGEVADEREVEADPDLDWNKAPF